MNDFWLPFLVYWTFDGFGSLVPFSKWQLKLAARDWLCRKRIIVNCSVQHLHASLASIRNCINGIDAGIKLERIDQHCRKTKMKSKLGQVRRIRTSMRDIWLNENDGIPTTDGSAYSPYKNNLLVVSCAFIAVWRGVLDYYLTNNTYNEAKSWWSKADT